MELYDVINYKILISMTNNYLKHKWKKQILLNTPVSKMGARRFGPVTVSAQHFRPFFRSFRPPLKDRNYLMLYDVLALNYFSMENEINVVM